MAISDVLETSDRFKKRDLEFLSFKLVLQRLNEKLNTTFADFTGSVCADFFQL